MPKATTFFEGAKELNADDVEVVGFGEDGRDPEEARLVARELWLLAGELWLLAWEG